MKTTREIRASYLTSQGALIELFDEKRGQVSLGQTADITYHYAEVNIRKEYGSGYNTPGRIVVSSGMGYRKNGFLAMAKKSRIHATAPSLNAGSEKSRALQLEVQYISRPDRRELSDRYRLEAR